MDSISREFSLQLKLAKLFGFSENVPKKWKNSVKLFQMTNVFLITFSLVSVIAYMKENIDNVIEVSESLTTFLVIWFGYIKFIFCIMKSKEIFGIINEIKQLNKECE